MDDLVEWLRAQLDEDERIARAATAGPWSRMGRRVLDPSPPSDRLGIGMAVGHAAADADFNETAEHIVRHDPARVLREIDAKRALVDAYEQACRKRAEIADEHWGVAGPSGDLSAVELWKEHDAVAEALKPHVLRHAAVYADRPGYREEWRP